MRTILPAAMAARGTAAWAAAPAVKGANGLTREQAARYQKLLNATNGHRQAGRFEDAEKLTLQRVELLEGALGRAHWMARSERLRVEESRRLAAVPAEWR